GRHQGSEAQEDPGLDPGRPGPRERPEQGRPSGSDGAAPVEGLRRRAQVRELSVKFTLVTLGCDKNTVDSERYIADLEDRGATFTADAGEADVILVNTCGFIDAAKKESIDAIVEAGNRK